MKFAIALLIGLFLFTTNSHSVVIKDLNVIDNNRITKETIKTYGNIQIGKDYNDNELNKIIKDLYETNFFKNLSIEIKDQILILKVEENQIIQSVKI